MAAVRRLTWLHRAKSISKARFIVCSSSKYVRPSVVTRRAPKIDSCSSKGASFDESVRISGLACTCAYT